MGRGEKDTLIISKTRDNYAFKLPNKVLGNGYRVRVIVLQVWEPGFESQQSGKTTKMAARACAAPATARALGRSVDERNTGSCCSAHLASELQV